MFGIGLTELFIIVPVGLLAFFGFVYLTARVARTGWDHAGGGKGNAKASG